jgi:hypothetical protein
LKFTRLHLISSVSLALLASPAFALNGQDILDKINLSNQPNDITIGAGSIKVEGDSVIYSDTTVQMKNGDPVNFGTVTLSGVEQSEKGYAIDEAAFDDVTNKAEDGKVTLTLVDLELKDIFVPATPDYRTVDNVLFIGSGSTGALTLFRDDKPIASVASMETTTTKDEASGALVSDYSFTNFDIDLASPESEPASAENSLRDLGITRLTGDFETSGKWVLSSGQISSDKTKLSLDDIGTLDFHFDLSGYTHEFIEEVQKVTAQLAEPTPPAAAEGSEAANEASAQFGLGLLGLAQRITVNGFKVRFEDDSITKRVINQYATKTSMQPEQLINSIKGMVPLMLAQYQLPSIQQSATEAVGKFLDDPKNITITAAPEQALPVQAIIGAGMLAPDSIIKMLGVTIDAND